MRYQNYEFQVPREKVIRVITDTDAKMRRMIPSLWYIPFCPPVLKMWGS